MLFLNTYDPFLNITDFPLQKACIIITPVYSFFPDAIFHFQQINLSRRLVFFNHNPVTSSPLDIKTKHLVCITAFLSLTWDRNITWM